jgi:hemolysin activation/secretion protein
LATGTVLAWVILGCAAGAVLAQAPPPSPPTAGDAIKQAAPPATPGAAPAPGEAFSLPTPEIVAEPEKPPALPDSGKLFVNSIAVAGSNEDEREKLAPILTPYINRELTMAEIDEAARKVTRFYRDRGYLVARAYVLKQAAQEGVLTITLVRGNYGVVTVKNRSRVRQQVVQDVFGDMKRDSPSVTEGSLERAMMLVGEMPGGAVPNVSIQPGQAPGATDLQVKVGEAPRLQGYLLGDNQGSQFTGRERLYGGLDVNSPLGTGDKLSVSAMMTEADELHNGRVAYSVPLNYNGLRLAVSASRTLYTLGGVYQVLDGTGAADAIDGTLSYAVRRRPKESIDFSVDYAHKELHDDLAAVDTHNPRNADVGTVTLQGARQGSFLGHNLYTTLSTSVALGQLAVLDPTQRRLGNIDGTYSKLNGTLTAEAPLAGNLSAKTSLVMQKDLADKDLDSSEQLFISGSGGVRAYAEGTSGDNGYILNLEFRYALPKWHRFRFQQTVALFADNGAVDAQEKGTSLTNFVINDVGPAYYVNFHPAFLSVQVARMLGPIHQETGKTRVWVQLGFVF